MALGTLQMLEYHFPSWSRISETDCVVTNSFSMQGETGYSGVTFPSENTLVPIVKKGSIKYHHNMLD